MKSYNAGKNNILTVRTSIVILSGNSWNRNFSKVGLDRRHLFVLSIKMELHKIRKHN